jgi:hypothetical protein
VRRNRTRLDDNLAALDVFALGATKKKTTVLAGRMPTTSTSELILRVPRSARPVTTVPRPVIVKTSSIGIRKGLSLSRTGSGK